MSKISSLAFSSNIAKFLEVVETTILKSSTLGGNWRGSEKPEIPFLALARENVMQFKEFS